jgi:uncharacterized protein (DUF2252 family)
MQAESLGMAGLVALILRLQRARIDDFDRALFSDPAWDILLELFSARLENRSLTLEDLDYVGPATVRSRWIATLIDRGLVSGNAFLAGTDLRLELTATAATKMDAIFQTASG